MQIPQRARPFDKARIVTPAWQRLLIGRDLSPTRAEYDAVVGALRQGDPAADALVGWMLETGLSETRPLFRQALEQGLASLDQPPPALVAFFCRVETAPGWVDQRLIQDGIDFIHGSGLAAPYVLRDLALMGGYLLSGFNHVLVMTGALNKDTSLRIAETGKWWIECTTAGGLDRFGAGFKSTLQVRLVHALVRQGLARQPQWDDNQWGVPINQIDMAATYLGFCVVMLGGLRKLGIPVTAHESRSVMHLWAYIGWLMGVDEQWLVHSERAGILLLAHTFMTQSRPDWTTRELARSLAQEPLQRTYPNLHPRLARLRGRLAYAQHLSVSHYFLGSKKMRQLGLPENISAWYPVLTTVPRFVGYVTQRSLPSLRARLQRRGRSQQLQALQQMFGNSEQAVGVNRDQAITKTTGGH